MIKKTIIPKTTPSTNNQKPITDNTNSQLRPPVAYAQASKETIGQIIGRTIPKQLIPTKKFGSIFVGIFILVLIIAVFQFPFGSFLSGNIEITIKVGFPLTFLELELVETDKSPLKILNLILDLLIYILLAYGIEVVLNLILKNPLLQSEKKINPRPTVFKNLQNPAPRKIPQKKI